MALTKNQRQGAAVLLIAALLALVLWLILRRPQTIILEQAGGGAAAPPAAPFVAPSSSVSVQVDVPPTAAPEPSDPLTQDQFDGLIDGWLSDHPDLVAAVGNLIGSQTSGDPEDETPTDPPLVV